MVARKIADALGITAWRDRLQSRHFRRQFHKNFDENFEAIRVRMVRELLELTGSDGKPNLSALNLQVQGATNAVHLSMKAFGADLAARHFGKVATTREPVLHDAFVTRWQPTRFRDYLQAWFLDTCQTLQIAPILHRKIWEEVYIVNTLRQAGKLAPGMRGIVFGVGEERLPAYFAAQGVEVLATDLAPENANARDWIATAQHGSLEKLFHGQYVQREVFDRLVSFRHADMNDIPAEFDGQFDFCWSICAFEHLGSIEQGLRFVERSGRLLKPGGVAVHTSEFNYTSNDATVDNWMTVLFRRRDYESLAQRLRQAGYELPPVEFDLGDTPVDAFVDLPPYAWDTNRYRQPGLDAVHLKLLVDGFPSTCFGVTFKKPAA